MKRLISLVLVVIINVAASSTTTPPLPLARISKSVSMHSVLNWPAMTSGNLPEYSWPPFADEKHLLSGTSLTSLKKSGFDTVRLTVGLGIFLSAGEEHKALLQSILRQRVNAIIQAGFTAIVDFHPISQDPRFPPLSFTRAVGSPNVEAFRGLLIETATQLAEFPTNRVALEILNEPQMQNWGSQEAALWETTERSYYTSIRKVAPKLTLILTGCCGGSIDGLTKLHANSFNDPNVYYTFHYYLPYGFTHQGVWGAKQPYVPNRFLNGVPFPIDDQNFSNVQKSAEDSLAAASIENPDARRDAESQLKKMLLGLQSQGNDEYIRAQFDRVTSWASSNGVDPKALFLGEFGVMRSGVDDNSRMAWLSAVRGIAESKGIAWSYWDYDEPQYMGLALKKDPTELDPVILRGLGLRGE